MTQRAYVYLTASFWFLMGAWLMVKGLKFVSYGIFDKESIFTLWSIRTKSAFLISTGLFGGYLKGKYILSKSALRVAGHIRSLTLPISFWKVYTRSYWLLIASMMALGMLLNFLPIPLEVRGCLDLAIGAALIRGSFSYLW